MPAHLLTLSGVTRHFGGVQAVDQVSLEIEAGTIFGLIGPNGAGKTTLVNLITGYVPLQSGRIELEGRPIGGRAPHQIATLGVARTFQTIRLYKHLTALANVLVGMHSRRKHDTLQQIGLLPVFRRGQLQRVAEARQLLSRVGLEPERFQNRRAMTLSYGDQRRLEIARALALGPRLLLLDEPAAGMNPAEKDRIRELIEGLNADGLTILLIDHDMRLVMGVCRQLAVLNFGRRIALGTPAEVSADPAVVTAYLGTQAGEEGATAAPGAAGPELAAPVGAALRVADPSESVRPPDAPAAMLEVRELRVGYGAVEAVKGVTFSVDKGEVVALIGANGAGKSTILNALSGVLRPHGGSAVFDGLDLGTAPTHRIVSHGLIQVPEGREVLARQTVRENLALGAWSRRDGRAVASEIEELMDRFEILKKRRNLAAGQLSGGEQQILAIARGLLGKPRLLLLDEPSLGLAPQTVDLVFGVIQQIHAAGTTILLVEQNALRALEVAGRAYVVETGRVLLTGTGEALRRDPAVRKAYLGG
ncbi:MAG: ATP-binding cassette domain-containing protein [Candidatus Dormibacteraeota bacterium]|nr:ATP-binding cassette domain-containing protein [Candidatus Dormibacteraeota bacterium]